MERKKEIVKKKKKKDWVKKDKNELFTKMKDGKKEKEMDKNERKKCS